MIPNCLRTVLIRKNLADAVAECEFKHNQDLDALAGDFVQEVIKYSRDVLTNSELLKDAESKSGTIRSLVYLERCSSELVAHKTEIEKRLHYIYPANELGRLLTALIESVVYTHEQDLIEASR